ncbi:MAG: glycosyl hydrolase [Phormidesmis sp. CAN_BIN36]|nr:glycosyl hydrolase [Phormidesmis sp. CAN_BIN36]
MKTRDPLKIAIATLPSRGKSRRMLRSLVLLVLITALGNLAACRSVLPSTKASSPVATAAIDPSASPVSTTAIDRSALLNESWNAYRQRFIQSDGRVIDREATGRSTSEGQAYAMLRAVFANDPDSFALTLKWSESNLQRLGANKKPIDHLWTWQWGRDPAGKWGTLDNNFASDADIDAITALILASRRWGRPEYLSLAKTKLVDLWESSTIAANNQRYLMPGPIAAFQQGEVLTFNTSYLAPYAIRLFAQVDDDRDWLSLVESSYQVLEQSASLSAVNLPSDWVALNLKTGQYSRLDKSNAIISRYGFDATRVWWRVSLDAVWFNEPNAKAYLQKHLNYMKTLWRSQQKIPAQLDLQGQPLVTYEATSQYGMLYAAFQVVDPVIAQQIYQQKLVPNYQNGFWDNDSAYYTQNLAWLGLFPPATIAPYLSQSSKAAQTLSNP